MSRQALQTAWRFLRPCAPAAHPSSLPLLLPTALPRAAQQQQQPAFSTAAPAPPADPFTAKLQKGAEQQLLEMVEAARTRKLQGAAQAAGGAQQAAEEDEEDDMVEVGALAWPLRAGAEAAGGHARRARGGRPASRPPSSAPPAGGQPSDRGAVRPQGQGADAVR
jgi:hypothetical protein